MISIRDIHVTFGKATPLENHVLKGISLDIPKSQFVTVIGSNGAGKSTLLNTLSGEVSVDHGSIVISESDCTKLKTHQRAKWIGRVFQDPKAGTCENLTILENLALSLQRGEKRRLRNFAKSNQVEIFESRLRTLGLGLETRLNDKMGLLSGGQRQAISLLMATNKPCDLLLLDEHTAALDPKTAKFVMELTEKVIAEQQLTALMVTHSMRQALDFGGRTIMLHAGRIAFDVGSDERENLGVPDLLRLFEKNQGESISDDSLLLG
jgi:putative ABC transport system ATP-binding protein